jgi:ribosome-binding protein aMBF1 (putative translation factor)
MSNIETIKAAIKQKENQAIYTATQATAGTMRTIIEKMGKTIKEERLKKGWSQRELARRSGYSQGTITRAENQMWISMYCLFHIAQALGKDIKLIDK